MGRPVSLGHSLDSGWAVAQVNQDLESQVCLLEPDPLCVPCFFLESDFFSSLITRRQFELRKSFLSSPLLLEFFNDNILSYY